MHVTRKKINNARRELENSMSSRHEDWWRNSLVFLYFVGFLPRLLSQLLLPDVIGNTLVQVGKEDIEHLRVPAYCMAFDALLDVL